MQYYIGVLRLIAINMIEATGFYPSSGLDRYLQFRSCGLHCNWRLCKFFIDYQITSGVAL